ncbi:glycosyl hydrolase [Ereboglobus luteus]|uniref:Beta-mannosidase-like galactose-binding domain-containing protein n=1 Tax=Ereboglobus luteus TaxID=1796921 RepID=A0A2U8E4L4_9BACT|nr:glycosyl hydrolase [Ereboglobus luteus]AWI09462.1 hypothetical protein CKA38_09575 [Ereboglobus luteus]
MKTHALAAGMLLCGALACTASASMDFHKYTTHNPDLPRHTLNTADFAAPSGFAKPQTWWHWINGNVSREGIENDLREMAGKGYGFARIFSVNSKLQGPLIFGSPEWFDTFKFTVETASKYGMGIGIHNCDGWSEAGGPWITPELSMKELSMKTIRVTGNGAEQTIPLPALDRKLDFARDIAVLAWPAKRPALLAMHKPGVLQRVYPSNEYTKATSGQREFRPGPGGLPKRSSDGEGGLVRLFDGMADDKRVGFSYEKKSPDQFAGVTLEFAEPFEAAGIFTEVYWIYELPLNIFLEASDDGVNFEKVCELKFHQSDTSASFEPRRAKFWRVVRYQSKKPTERVHRGVVKEHVFQLSEIELLAPGENSRAAFPIDNFPAKAGVVATHGQVRATTAAYPEKLILKPGEIQNLTANTADNGDTLRWRVPDGEWVVMRIGYTTTGKVIHPATPAGRGLEVDKFEPSAVEHHFDSYDRKMIAAAGPLAGKTFSIIETDSWEAGHQNWSENFDRYFREQNGYDILPWLPVYAGECIGSVDTTENFLRDLRRTFSSLVMNNFYGKLGSLARDAGLKYETEPASGIFMRDPMNSYREADFPMTEVWQDAREAGVVAGIRTAFSRETASTAHFYGKQYVTCEALTSRKGNWAETPWIMKGTLDTLLLAGPNVSVFHTYTHQPDERAPGWQMEPWGVSQNRKMPWWPLSKAWFSYIARVQYMLQQGKYAARILHFYSDEIPTTPGSLSTKTAHQYDIINGDGVRDFLRVENGRLLSPGQMRYDVMFISPHTTLRLETLEKLKSLLAAGATIAAGQKPVFNPTLRGGDAAKKRWHALADELFGDGSKAARRLGKGTLHVGHTPDEIIAALKLREPFTCVLDNAADSKDLAWQHREHADGTEWFWVINRDSSAGRSGIMSFRVTGKKASLWHPETGKTEPVPAAIEEEGRTLIPLSLGKLEGVFVIFENKTPSRDTAVKIIANGKEIFPKSVTGGKAVDNTKISGDFTFAVTVSPSGTRKITKASAAGIAPGGGGNENFALYPEQMHIKLNDMKHACAGLSVGKNSIAVFEHGAGYLNSIIVHDHPVAENTRIAVVYKNNTPALYINGKQVAAASKSSGRIVHPPSAVRAQYKGSASNFSIEKSALSASEVVAFMNKTEGITDSRDKTAEPKLFMTNTGKLAAEFLAPGNLEIKKANGSKMVLFEKNVPPPTTISGPFAVTFESKWGAPADTQHFEKLVSWTESPVPGIRHYSGMAVYTKDIELTSREVAANQRVYLEIDQVCEVAEVTVNGKRAGTLWRPPYKLDITDCVRVGKNALQISVANTWVNRCLHDATLPESERLTWANSMQTHYPDPKTIKPTDYYPWKYGPLPSGLIGEARLVFTKLVEEK